MSHPLNSTVPGLGLVRAHPEIAISNDFVVGGNFNLRDIEHMPAVKISVRLELDEKSYFYLGYYEFTIMKFLYIQFESNMSMAFWVRRLVRVWNGHLLLTLKGIMV